MSGANSPARRRAERFIDSAMESAGGLPLDEPARSLARCAMELAHDVVALDSALRSVQQVAVMSQNHHAEPHRLAWLREIEDIARDARAPRDSEAKEEVA